MLMGRRADEFVAMGSDYNENSATQALGADIVAGYLTKYASAAAVDTVIRVGEYGCATGGSTLAPLAAIQNACPPSAEMEVYLNDLPLNDWEVTKKTVEPHFKSASIHYVKRCMYESAIVPPGTLNLGYTCFAQHWLSGGVPTMLTSGTVWANQLPPDHPFKAQWSAMSAKDWERFLVLRAEEFAPGGTLVALVQSSAVDGTLTEQFATPVGRAKARLVAEGKLTDDEAAKLVIPEYPKSTYEILAPFVNSSPVKSFWDIKEMQMVELPCPYRAKFDAGELTKSELIEAQLRVLRSFMDSSLVESLKGISDATAKLETLWEYVRELGHQGSGALDTNFTCHILVLRRASL